jgi:hypothetical protein
MTIPACEDFEEIARNLKRIREEPQPKQVVKPTNRDDVSMCSSCGYPVTNPDGDCDGGTNGGCGVGS